MLLIIIHLTNKMLFKIEVTLKSDIKIARMFFFFTQTLLIKTNNGTFRFH